MIRALLDSPVRLSSVRLPFPDILSNSVIFRFKAVLSGLLPLTSSIKICIRENFFCDHIVFCKNILCFAQK